MPPSLGEGTPVPGRVGAPTQHRWGGSRERCHRTAAGVGVAGVARIPQRGLELWAGCIQWTEVVWHWSSKAERGCSRGTAEPVEEAGEGRYPRKEGTVGLEGGWSLRQRSLRTPVTQRETGTGVGCVRPSKPLPPLHSG